MFWRSLEEKERSNSERTLAAEAELPFGATDVPTGFIDAADLKQKFIDDSDPRLEGVGQSVSRRGFMKFSTAISALFGLEGCARRPVEKILPYTHAPEYTIPGVSNHFATVVSTRGEALGLVVESHEGRPTKVEGNPLHPASLGATDMSAQAMVFDLYDPDRSRHPISANGGSRSERTYEDFEKAFDALMKGHEGDQGTKLRFLVEPSNSPTELRLRGEIKRRFPKAQFHVDSATDDLAPLRATQLAFGKGVRPIVDYARAKIIVALESDFLHSEAGAVLASRQFADGRRLKSAKDSMSRLYAVESIHSVTGATADHRLRLLSRDVERFARLLAKELAGSKLPELGALGSGLNTAPEGIPAEWLKEVAADLLRHRERAVVVAGSNQPVRVQALVHAINSALGSQVVSYTPAINEEELALPGLAALTKDMEANAVDTLVIVGGNPAYTAPSDIRFKEALAKVKTSVHLASHDDETSRLASWHVPRAHVFEAWSDARGFDGTWSVQQPMIQALHGAWGDLQLLSHAIGPHSDGKYRTGSSRDFVRETVHEAFASEAPFDVFWENALKNGVVGKSTLVPLANKAFASTELAAELAKPTKAAQGLEVVCFVDPKIGDGRQANNPWLQELPDPMTRIVWDNAAHVSPKTARDLGLSRGDMIEISTATGKTEAAVWIQPGQADGSIGLSLGWGRTVGRYATASDKPENPLHIYPVATARGRGFNAYPLRSSTELSAVSGASVRKTGGTYKIVQTQDHHAMEGRAIAIYETLERYGEKPSFANYKVPKPRVLPLWKPQDYSKGSPTNPSGHKWGLVTDLNACTGCGVCVVACQAENNIPIVGKDQVYRGREMHWIRIDRYFVGNTGEENHDEAAVMDPKVAFIPVTCQQCEQAPCENVCPVNATEHSPEGLNDMAYNRCIGTRYCANNCPYKVRRFNYLEFQGDPMYGDLPETVKMQFNPNVTVRMRGVIEKCTYCVQRIQEARIGSRRSGKPMKDGDITVACQQACPAQAIVFGDLNDPNSRVSQARERDRNYELLADVGTHPRSSYLGKILNPNASIKDASYDRIFSGEQSKTAHGKEEHG